ncbi:hypothetical protein CLOP_g3969 [Closterium sp. NIES-67]|nr:hypothetical protein CLOP_g3969 [Closterium sp. NIES-67]
MGFIAATLLMNMGEEHAFTCLVFLMYRCGLRGVFLPDMQQLQLRMYQLTQLLIDVLPRVHAFFEHLEIKPVMYAADWFLTLFARTMPHYLVFRVFDIILAEQTTAIVFKLAIVLLQVCRRQLQQCPEMEYAMCLLRTELPAQLKEMSEEDMEELVCKAMRVDLPFESLLRLEAEYDLLAGEAAAAARDVQAAAQASEVAALSWATNRQELETCLSHVNQAVAHARQLTADITSASCHLSYSSSPPSLPPHATKRSLTPWSTMNAMDVHAGSNGVGGATAGSDEERAMGDSSRGGILQARARGEGCVLVNGSGAKNVAGSRVEHLNGTSCTEEGGRALEGAKGEVERVCEEDLPLEERVGRWQERVAVVGGSGTVGALREKCALQYEWTQVAVALAMVEREVVSRLDMGGHGSDPTAGLGALVGAHELVVVEEGGDGGG